MLSRLAPDHRAGRGKTRMPYGNFSDLRLLDGGPFVVGGGASAGTFEAFQTVLSAPPELLAKRIAMPISAAEDEMRLEPGRIYPIPPGAFIAIADGPLSLTEMLWPRFLRRPINKFFESLSAHAGTCGAGIDFSGTGSEGRVGVRAVKGTGDEIRVWVPGSSTGQEAIAIAMQIAEELERIEDDTKVAIFATEIEEDALRVARKGVFPNVIIDEVPASPLARYFKTTSEGYEVRSKPREMVRFSNESITNDPPLAPDVPKHVDNDLQGFTTQVLHFALKDDGHPLLGPAETTRIIDDRPDAAPDPSVVAVRSDVAGHDCVQELEFELDRARKTIDELETSNKELKRLNEQMMSMNEALQSSNEELSATNDVLQFKIGELYDVTPQAMALLSADGTYLRVSNKMAEINGLSADDHIGRSMRDTLPVLARRMEGKTPASGDERRLFSTDGYPVMNADEVVAIGVDFRDITEQTEIATEHRRVVQELQHRVKNMLANVLALVSHARRDATVDLAVVDTLAARIKALAHTHKVLTQENWRAANIYSLIGPETRDIYGSDRVTLKGPALQVNARAALALGMVIHELATNAAKYGAFSTDGGKVSLTWLRLDYGAETRVVFTWKETGGPKVEQRHRQGFGSQLIASTINGTLHGNADFKWEEDGLLVALSMPFEEINVVKDDVVYGLF